jgi:von Willebrand factor type A C-terminal domain
MVDDRSVASVVVKSSWTDDPALSTSVNPDVAHHAGQADLAHAIQSGLRARRTGDLRAATIELGRAFHLAAESGNDQTLQLLTRLVDVDVDGDGSGTVRLKSRVDRADEMALDTRSTRTVCRPSRSP